jgi:RNA-directed DNA polymerase
MNVSTKQQRIAELATQRPEASFTSLNHYLDVDWLREAYRCLRKDSAPGYDGHTVADYGKELVVQQLDIDRCLPVPASS